MLRLRGSEAAALYRFLGGNGRHPYELQGRGFEVLRRKLSKWETRDNAQTGDASVGAWVQITLKPLDAREVADGIERITASFRPPIKPSITQWIKAFRAMAIGK